MSTPAATAGPAHGPGTTASGQIGCCEPQRWRSCSASVRGPSGSGPGEGCCRPSGHREGSTASRSVPYGSCSTASVASPTTSNARATTIADPCRVARSLGQRAHEVGPRGGQAWAPLARRATRRAGTNRDGSHRPGVLAGGPAAGGSSTGRGGWWAGVGASGADGEAGAGEGALDFGDGELAEVEDAGCEDGVGTGLAGGDEVVEVAGASAGDDGDVDGVGHGGDELEVVAGFLAVGVHAGDQQLAGAAACALLGPGEGVAAGGGAAAVDDDLPPGAVGAAAGIDGQHHALGPVGVGPGREQLRVAHGGGVDRDLVGAGAQQAPDVLGSAHPSPDGERDEHLLGRAADDVVERGARLHGGGDVEEDQLVGALGVVDGGQLDGVAGVDQVDEGHALDDPAGGHVQAGDHPPRERHDDPPLPLRVASASATVKRPAYSALPTMTPSRPRTASGASARRSSRLETPPEAITGRSVAARTSPRLASAGPVSMPSLATSV